MEPPPIPAMDADHPDLYIPEPVKIFLPYFQRMVADKVIFISDAFMLNLLHSLPCTADCSRSLASKLNSGK